MRKNKRKEYVELLRAKRLEVVRIGNELNTATKRLNIEIDMLLELLGMSDEELSEVAEADE